LLDMLSLAMFVHFDGLCKKFRFLKSLAITSFYRLMLCV
jgi:hypothetical protein